MTLASDLVTEADLEAEPASLERRLIGYAVAAIATIVIVIKYP